MNTFHVWLVVVTTSVLLGFVGYHFTVRTLRIFTAALGTVVVVLVTRYGVAHHRVSAPTDLVNSFTRGFGDLSVAFFGSVDSPFNGGPIRMAHCMWRPRLRVP